MKRILAGLTVVVLTAVPAMAEPGIRLNYRAADGTAQYVGFSAQGLSLFECRRGLNEDLIADLKQMVLDDPDMEHYGNYVFTGAVCVRDLNDTFDGN